MKYNTVLLNFVFTIGRHQKPWYNIYHILHICFYTFIYDILSTTDWMIIYHYHLLGEYHFVINNPRAMEHILKILEFIFPLIPWII